MSVTFLITLVLTAAITFFVIGASLILVLHKNSTRHRQEILVRLRSQYSEIVSRFLMLEVEGAPTGFTSGRHFQLYEDNLRAIHDRMAGMSARKRERHRTALGAVLLDFSKDLSGESLERIIYLAYTFGFIDEMVSRLNDSRWWIRAQAARDLGLLGAKRAIAPLTAALEDPNADVRFQAIEALILLVGVDALRTVFRIGRNLTVWNMMALSVIVLRFREDAVPYLLEGLDAKDQSIVVFCIEMLAEIGFVSAVDPLRTVAREYPNVHVRTKAIEALGRLGDSRAVPLLMEGAGNSFPKMRVAALHALRQVGTPTAIPTLVARLREGSLEEKIAAGRAMIATGAKGAQQLKKMLHDPDPLTAGVAAQVLEELHAGEGG